MVHLYETDAGPVRISEQEAGILSTAELIEKLGIQHQCPWYMAKAHWIRATCERVAEWKRTH